MSERGGDDEDLFAGLGNHIGDESSATLVEKNLSSSIANDVVISPFFLDAMLNGKKSMQNHMEQNMKSLPQGMSYVEHLDYTSSGDALLNCDEVVESVMVESHQTYQKSISTTSVDSFHSDTDKKICGITITEFDLMEKQEESQVLVPLDGSNLTGKVDSEEKKILSNHSKMNATSSYADTSTSEEALNKNVMLETNRDVAASENTTNNSQSMFLNRFAMLKVRADQVLSSQVIKNIEEKRKEVQKAVEERVLSNVHRQQDRIVPDIISENGSDDEKHQTSTSRQSSSQSKLVSRKATGPVRSTIDIPADDDMSFSTKDSLVKDSHHSDASSVYADSDASYSSYSDESSIYIPESKQVSSTKKGDLNPTPIKSNSRIKFEPSFHGRYGDPNDPPRQSRESVLDHLTRNVRVPSPIKRQQRNSETKYESQTSLINRVLPAAQFKALLKSLKKGEYVMLLGNGMLGVNLKQTYLSGNGVYIDHIAPEGNAEKSGVICIGDSLVKVGNEDVTKGTIFNVPEIIANAKRPCVLILSGEHHVDWSNMDYIDVAIGMANQILSEFKNGASHTTFDSHMMMLLEDVDRSLYEFVTPLAPPVEIRKELADISAKKNCQGSSIATLSLSCKEDRCFQYTLREAFHICCVDSRRLPFLTAFLSEEDLFIGEIQANSPSFTSNSKLMLYLELLSFREVFNVATPRRRLDHARRIFFKFFNTVSEGSFNIRSIIPSNKFTLLHECVDSGQEDSVHIALFYDVEKYLEKALSGPTFASFLISHHCSRMRAYLRGTSPFMDVPLEKIISSAAISAHNHLIYIILYLLCKVENDTMNKNYIDRISYKRDGREFKRLKGAVAGVGCAIFITQILLPSIETVQKSSCAYSDNLVWLFEMFWESFISPSGGALETISHSNDTNNSIEKLRKSMFLASQSPSQHIQEALTEPKFMDSLKELRKDLIYDYCVNYHPKFRSHTIHEYMCSESILVTESKHEYFETDTVPRLSYGCISRLVRKIEIPKSISRHSPMHPIDHRCALQPNKPGILLNADYAVLFGSSSESAFQNLTPQDISSSHYPFSVMKRLAYAPLNDFATDQLQKMRIEKILPATLESYATIPALRERPFKQSLNHGRKSRDGWEISLVNFMAPFSSGAIADTNASFLYGTSLVLNYTVIDDNQKPKKERVIALMLVSERCVIPAIRKTLSQLFQDKVVSKPFNGNCAELVEILESFNSASGNTSKLADFLDPYIRHGSSEWLSKPLIEQELSFETASLHVLVDSLPPIALSLLFVTAILEQKVVFTSSRRSTLVSVIIALRSLLRPLSWSHLVIPTAPLALAYDLLQYPGPFLLGIPLDNQENMELLKSIPSDITLVDVDVGRVILAQNFSHHFHPDFNNELGRNATMSLRSQVLHLSELLGNIVGLHQTDYMWRSDNPMAGSAVDISVGTVDKIESTKTICASFIRELISGINTCCYWIEEKSDEQESESFIFFDEDRFIDLKRMRGNGKFVPLFCNSNQGSIFPCLESKSLLALSVDDFNLILETFLRGQGLSTYISSQKKEYLVFH